VLYIQLVRPLNPRHSDRPLKGFVPFLEFDASKWKIGHIVRNLTTNPKWCILGVYTVSHWPTSIRTGKADAHGWSEDAPGVVWHEMPWRKACPKG